MNALQNEKLITILQNKLFMLNKQALSALFNNQEIINIYLDKVILTLTLNGQIDRLININWRLNNEISNS